MSRPARVRPRRPGDAARHRPGRWRQRGAAYTLIAPVVVLTVIFSVVPLVMVIRRSLYKGNIFDIDLKFSGLANYRDVFRTGGGHALRVTAVYTVSFVVITMVVGFLVALLLDVRLPGLSWVRGLFIIPLVVPAVATALIWFTLFQPDTGLVNRLALDLGLPQATLDSGRTALISVIAFGAWQFFGEVVLLYLAALKSLPGDVLEAAVIDGASAWQRLRYVRWPLLRNQTALVGVIATLTGLQAFTQIYVLTPDGGPGNSTETALYYVYQEAFGLGAGGSAGRADAMAAILFLVSLVITLGQLAIVARATRSQAAS